MALARLLIALVLAWLLLVSPGLSPAAGSLAPPAAANRSGPTLPRYSLDLRLDYHGATVAVNQTTRFRNATGQALDRAVFQVMPAALGAFQLGAASALGQPVTAMGSGSMLDVPFPWLLPPGGDAEIGLSYVLALPRAPGRISASGGTVALGNWYPTLAPHRGDWERHQYLDIGDSFVTEAADFDVRLTTSVPLVVAASGDVVRENGTTFRSSAQGLRDFALSVAPDYAVAEARSGGTIVRAYTRDGGRSREFAEGAARFLSWFSGRLGTYPYPTLSLAENDVAPPWTGTEYPGLIFLAPSVKARGGFEGSGAEELIAHEVAHQWFYGIVGSDGVRDPWLDEAIAEYLPYHYFRNVRPDFFPSAWKDRILGGLDEQLRATGQAPLNGSIYDFKSRGRYYWNVYRRGARFVDELRAAMGDGAFDEALREEVRIFSGKVASPLAVLDIFQRQTSKNLNPLISRYFSYPGFADPQPARWQLDLRGNPWYVNSPVAVSADFPITRFELWLDGRRMHDGPETALRLDLGDVEPGEYALIARVWDQRGVPFERAARVVITTGP